MRTATGRIAAHRFLHIWQIFATAMQENAKKTARTPSPTLLRGEMRAPEQFQQKCAAVLRPELRKNKRIDRFYGSQKS
jgi:hypothetical protein